MGPASHLGREIRPDDVIPSLPVRLERLGDLAHNLRWAWHHDTIELFRRLDDDLWETPNHNPVLMLGTIDQAQLEAAATDEGFLAHLDRVARDFDAYTSAGPVLSLPKGSGHRFEAGAVPCRKSGLHGYTVRVLPHHPDLTTPFLPGLIVWAGPDTKAVSPRAK